MMFDTSGDVFAQGHIVGDSLTALGGAFVGGAFAYGIGGELAGAMAGAMPTTVSAAAAAGAVGKGLAGALLVADAVSLANPSSPSPGGEVNVATPSAAARGSLTRSTANNAMNNARGGPPVQRPPGLSLFDPEAGALACNGGGDVCMEIQRQRMAALQAEMNKKIDVIRELESDLLYLWLTDGALTIFRELRMLRAARAAATAADLGAFSQRTIGNFVLVSRSGLQGTTFVHEISVIASTSAKEATRAEFASLAGTLTAEARAAGATGVEIRGIKVINPGILRLQGLAKDLGFTVKQVGKDFVTFAKGL